MPDQPRFRIAPLPHAVVERARRVFRCDDAAKRIVDACVGTAAPEALIAGRFANPALACIHVRAPTHGCFTFKIERA